MYTDENEDEKKPYFIARGGSIFLYDQENTTLGVEIPYRYRLVGPQPSDAPNWFTELQAVDPYMVLSELEARRGEIEQAIKDLLDAMRQIEGAGPIVAPRLAGKASQE